MREGIKMSKNIKDMNMNELENYLFEMAEETTLFKHFQEQIDGIIHTIIKFYAVNDGYYPEDAVRSFKRFLTTGTLEF